MEISQEEVFQVSFEVSLFYQSALLVTICCSFTTPISEINPPNRENYGAKLFVNTVGTMQPL